MRCALPGLSVPAMRSQSLSQCRYAPRVPRGATARAISRPGRRSRFGLDLRRHRLPKRGKDHSWRTVGPRCAAAPLNGSFCQAGTPTPVRAVRIATPACTAVGACFRGGRMAATGAFVQSSGCGPRSRMRRLQSNDAGAGDRARNALCRTGGPPARRRTSARSAAVSGAHAAVPPRSLAADDSAAAVPARAAGLPPRSTEHSGIAPTAARAFIALASVVAPRAPGIVGRAARRVETGAIPETGATPEATFSAECRPARLRLSAFLRGRRPFTSSESTRPMRSVREDIPAPATLLPM